MAEDDEYQEDYGHVDVVRQTWRARRAAREGEQRAAEYLTQARRCQVCGTQIATPGRNKHFSCDPEWSPDLRKSGKRGGKLGRA